MENLPYVAPLDLCINQCWKMELHEWINEVLPTILVRTAREKFCKAQFSTQRQRVSAEDKALHVLGAKKKVRNDEPSNNTGYFSGYEKDRKESSSSTGGSLKSSQPKPRLPKAIAITLVAGRTFGPIGEHYHYSEPISLPEAPEIPSWMHYVVPAPFRISPLRLSANSTFVENLQMKK